MSICLVVVDFVLLPWVHRIANVCSDFYLRLFLFMREVGRSCMILTHICYSHLLSFRSGSSGYIYYCLESPSVPSVDQRLCAFSSWYLSCVFDCFSLVLGLILLALYFRTTRGWSDSMLCDLCGRTRRWRPPICEVFHRPSLKDNKVNQQKGHSCYGHLRFCIVKIIFHSSYGAFSTFLKQHHLLPIIHIIMKQILQISKN